MTIDVEQLNNVVYQATDVAALPLSGFDAFNTPAGIYVVDPATGSIIDNYWSGTFGAPAPHDPVTFTLTAPTQTAGQNILEYAAADADGTVQPAIGFEVLAYNSTGIVGQEINGYFNGESAAAVAANLNANQFYVFSGMELSVTDPNFPSGPSAATLTFGQTGTFPMCFAAGTRIACEPGEIAVEDLRAGDRVVLADGGISTIVWIGRRRIDCRPHPEPERVLPIRIAPGAFGESEPTRPLFLSPEHAVFIDGVLIPIRLLANGRGIRQVECDSVTYYHIELEHHALLLADGLPAESFLDVAGRSWFDNGDSTERRGAERPEVAWECRACAPLVLTGEKLDAARRRLAARAQALEPAAKGMPAVLRQAGHAAVIST